MSVTRWTMKGDSRKTQRVGPVAQDFCRAFGLGSDDKTINSADAQGVSLTTIQGLYQKNQALERKVTSLEVRLDALERK